MGDSSVNHNLSRTRNIRMPDGESTTIRETGRFVEHSPDYNQPYPNKHEIPKKVAEYDQRPAIIENNPRQAQYREQSSRELPIICFRRL